MILSAEGDHCGESVIVLYLVILLECIFVIARQFLAAIATLPDDDTRDG